MLPSIFIVFLIVGYLLFNVKQIVNGYLFMPNKFLNKDTAGLAEEAEEININGVNCLFFDRGDNTDIILYSHGNAGNIYYLVGLSNLFPNQSLFLYDYRGYGKSSDVSVTGETILHDGEAVYQYIKYKYPKRRIIICGRSMGSSVAWFLSAKYSVSALVIISGFTSIRDIIDDYTLFFGSILSWFMFLPNNKLYVDKVTCPILLIHSIDDQLISVKHADTMQRLSNRKTSLILVNGNHNFSVASVASRITKFIELLPIADKNHV